MSLNETIYSYSTHCHSEHVCIIIRYHQRTHSDISDDVYYLIKPAQMILQISSPPSQVNLNTMYRFNYKQFLFMCINAAIIEVEKIQSNMQSK